MVRISEPSGKGHSPPRENEKNLLDWARYYLSLGWAIIPTKGKRAACNWKKFQTRCPQEAELTDLFCLPGFDGLAVIFGPVSGGLACRDFDKSDSYESWKKKHPSLAGTLPTVQTARGYHVYFRGPAKFKDLGNGEYRGDSGHYCLLPPSRHPTGPDYRWIIDLPDGELPVIDNPYKSGLMVFGTQRTQEIVVAGVSVSSVSSVFPMLIGIDEKDQRAVEMAILATLPEAEGQRHFRVFTLCRHLKAIPSLASAQAAKLRAIVREWHRRALPVIRTKEFSETWADFLAAWSKVKYLAGQGPIEEGFRQAKAAKPPQRVASLYPDEPKVILLAALCRELQKIAGERDFFLDCRTAGRLIGAHHMQIWRWLNAFCEDGILKEGEKGSRAKHRANQYHYVAWKRPGKALK